MAKAYILCCCSSTLRILKQTVIQCGVVSLQPHNISDLHTRRQHTHTHTHTTEYLIYSLNNSIHPLMLPHSAWYGGTVLQFYGLICRFYRPQTSSSLQARFKEACINQINMKPSYCTGPPIAIFAYLGSFISTRHDSLDCIRYLEIRFTSHTSHHVMCDFVLHHCTYLTVIDFEWMNLWRR